MEDGSRLRAWRGSSSLSEGRVPKGPTREPVCQKRGNIPTQINSQILKSLFCDFFGEFPDLFYSPLASSYSSSLNLAIDGLPMFSGLNLGIAGLAHVFQALI